MATGKRYYWIKLKESFMTSDAVDFLMGKPDGANYVVLYQMLCLKTINTGGKLERHIGEVIIPYDEAKIQRDTKWFSIDTVRVALNLYKALGLVYQDENGTLSLADYDNLVGSETDWADKRRRQRMGNSPAPELPSGDNVPSNVPTDVSENVPTDIEIRDQILEKEDREQSSEKEDETFSDENVCRPQDVRQVFDAWQSLGIQKLRKIPDATTSTGKMLRARIKDYGISSVLEAVEIVRNSDFLMGKVKDFQITFDWFVRPNNFLNIVNGKYDNRTNRESDTRHGREMKETYSTIERWVEEHANDSEGV